MNGTLPGIYCPSTMRRFVLVLMIALLPLRTWAGDVMAIDMVAGAQSASPSASSSALGQAASSVDSALAHHQMPSAIDCEGHAGTSSAESDAQAHCKTCVTCQICHSVVILAQAPGVSPPDLTPALTVVGAPRFTSAERAPSQKPPIA